jgi:hypothetical protein
MNRIIHLEDGKQITVGSDPRSPQVRLSIWANRGSLGLEMSQDQAIELSLALWRLAKR